MTDLSHRIFKTVGQLAPGHMTQHVQAALLHRVHKVDKCTGGARVVDEQQDLRPPELDMVLAGVQQQQIFAHLKRVMKYIWRKSTGDLR